ncbi:MAG: carbohydrate ABC transporter permease [Oscillospiraceae bacterium]|nr:carbohydrate ABC transporter permease [Oscillospiraceae bacterium]
MKNLSYKTASAGKHLVLILTCLIFVFPVYWMVISSFEGLGEIFSANMLPKDFTFDNYIYAFNNMPIGRMMLTSLIIAAALSVLQLTTGILAAYALSRFNFRGKGIITILFSLTWLIPVQSIMIPNYVTIIQMGLKENLLAVILPYAASAFAILNLMQSFNAFPKALIEASKMDGDGELKTLSRIVLPNLKAPLSSLGILLFINAWNEYMWPRLVMTKLESAPIQIGLRSFVGSDVNMWGSLMAATTISCLPIFVIYILLQKQVVDSFVKWGIK